MAAAYAPSPNDEMASAAQSRRQLDPNPTDGSVPEWLSIAYHLAHAKRMTIRIQLSGADVARVRFGLSAVAETVRSLRVLAEPGTSAIHLPWVRWAGSRVPDVADVAVLRRLLGVGSVPLALRLARDTVFRELRKGVCRVRQAAPTRAKE